MNAPGARQADLVAPIGVGGLFGDSGDDDEESGFQQQFEIQKISIGGNCFAIRQFSWHQANANQVWPGAIRLGEFLKDNKEKYLSGRCIELGAATGALAMWMLANGFDVITSDYDDDGAVVENIIFNFNANGIPAPRHVAYTWGNDWSTALSKSGNEEYINANSIKFIIASDILLYVSAYPALVSTIEMLFAQYGVEEFLMSWNRRIAESAIFFDLMKSSGYGCLHHGHCIYSFTKIGAQV